MSCKNRLVIFLIFVSIQISLSAEWQAQSSLPQPSMYSLQWCINQAAAGDTIVLLPGEHWGLRSFTAFRMTGKKDGNGNIKRTNTEIINCHPETRLRVEGSQPTCRAYYSFRRKICDSTMFISPRASLGFFILVLPMIWNSE
jgi:hypothetical protein